MYEGTGDSRSEKTFVGYYDSSDGTSDDGSTVYSTTTTPQPDERLPEPEPSLIRAGVGKHKRAGYTTNKGKPRNKARARMAKVSRVRNRR